VRFRAQFWSREAEWYWTVIDPLGAGFFGLFLPTAYCGGIFLNTINSQLADVKIISSSDADRYLTLVGGYVRLVDQFTARTTEQASRGMRMPRIQVQPARLLLEQFKNGIREVICAAPRRMSIPVKNDLMRELESLITTHIEPAFDRALEGLSDKYFKKAPDGVGLRQYRDGAAVYAELVKFHTTLDLTPEQVHAYGYERLAEIQSQKHAIRDELRFEGDDMAFLTQLSRDPRWRANTVEGVAAVFHRYINRITPHLGDCFSNTPKAPHRVEPLPHALERSMTYGYYELPARDHPAGLYLFNAGNLTKHPLCPVGALTYHELMPGHHLQVGLQYENDALHPFRRYSLLPAYNEGWAEYAATLAGEIGMYEEPEERYGRLMMDGLFASRLVVDTGMNVLEWSLQRARDYMHQNSGISHFEILTESVRYSCDIPGQGLAYKIGDRKIMQLRERMRHELRDRFDLKVFHAAVLATGAIPLPELEWHIACEIERLRV